MYHFFLVFSHLIALDESAVTIPRVSCTDLPDPISKEIKFAAIRYFFMMQNKPYEMKIFEEVEQILSNMRKFINENTISRSRLKDELLHFF